MSYWKKELFTSNFKPNSVTTWLPMDTEELYRQTVRVYAKMGKEFHWYPESFNYQLNEYGFRGPSPKSKADFTILVSGCSFTMGIGLPYEMTWPHLLSQMIPNSVAINFAIGGQSCDYVVNSIYKTIDVITPDLVAILWPPFTRLSVMHSRGNRTLMMGESDFPKVFVDPDHLKYYNEKNTVFIEMLCKQRNVPLIHMTSLDENSNIVEFSNPMFPEIDVARDNAHPGPLWQKAIAERMFEKYQKIAK